MNEDLVVRMAYNREAIVLTDKGLHLMVNDKMLDDENIYKVLIGNPLFLKCLISLLEFNVRNVNFYMRGVTAANLKPI